jgi:hypothetical protein
MGRRSKRKSKALKGLDAAPVVALEKLTIGSPAGADESRLVLITDRLVLPPYRNEDDELDSPELQLDIRPRGYFVSGLCYSCSRPCADPELLCEGCHVVGFCSPEHLRREAASHAPLCNVLANLERPGSAVGLDGPAYRRLRADLVLVAQKALGRVLEPREREILLYPRLCGTCHGAKDLERCPDCLVAYHCPGDHVLDHRRHCAQLRVLGRILEVETASGFVAPELPAFEVAEPPEDFDRLVRRIFRRHYERIDCASYAALSQTASSPLTALYVIGKLPRCEPYTVSPRARCPGLPFLLADCGRCLRVILSLALAAEP